MTSVRKACEKPSSRASEEIALLDKMFALTPTKGKLSAFAKGLLIAKT